ncbi:hypothetical protein [Hankyongella ginsenosidimutans]
MHPISGRCRTSPRNRPWLARNPWFEADLLPALRARVAQILV